MKKIKVLLVSPADPKNPTFGDATYSRLLLDNPPEGVEYTYYLDALREGKIKRTLCYFLFRFLYKTFIWWPDVHVECLKLRERFDLVHAHAHPIKIIDSSIPVILSDSSSNLVYLRDYKGIPERLVLLYYNLFRRPLAKLFNLADPNLNHSPIRKLIVWSKWAQDIHLKLGCPKEKIKVLSPGFPLPPKERINRHQNKIFTLLFVGMDFKRKGGPLLLEVFKILEAKYPFLQLILVSSLPQNISLQSKRIINYPFVEYSKLLNEILPQANLLILIPPKAEGYGLMPIQAAGYGIPSITTNIATFPELIENNKTGFLIKPNDKKELTKRLEFLIKNRNILKKMGELARDKFVKEFSYEAVNPKLREIYLEALTK